MVGGETLLLTLTTGIEGIYIISLVNNDISGMAKWSEAHGLRLNASKCKSIIIGSTNIISSLYLLNVPPIVINGHEVPFPIL